MKNLLYGIYCFLISALFILLLPIVGIYIVLTGKHRKGFGERLGIIPLNIRKQFTKPIKIWIHAASLGEVRVAISIIRALEKFIPESSLLLSTTTEHGHSLALETFKGRLPIIFAPIDFIGSVKMALTRLNPDIMVFLETEIWPTWITEAKRMGCRNMLLNGRISARSVRQYKKFRFFFRIVLGKMDLFSMISEEDAIRIQSMGAQLEKIKVNGNAKYDLLSDSLSKEKEVEIRKVYNAQNNEPVIIAGSTRGGEEIKLLYAFKRILQRFPKALLIIVPRHLTRVQEIEHLVSSHGFRYQLRSSFDGIKHKRQSQIVIVDRFGELFSLYSIGDINFCGASLVPLGGQNPLEAAIWGKIVFYGPYMDDFLDATSLLESVEAGIVVDNEDILSQKILWYLEHPEILQKSGERARDAVLSNRNAAEKHAGTILDLLNR